MLKRVLTLLGNRKPETSNSLDPIQITVPDASHIDPKNIKALIAFVCTYYENDAYIKREFLLKALTKIGISEFVAIKITSLVPEAYARPILESMKVEPSDLAIFIEQSTKNKLELKLSEDIAFLEALRIARETHKKSPALVKRVSNRSSTINAMNTALKNGSNPKDIVCSPMFINVKKLD